MIKLVNYIYWFLVIVSTVKMVGYEDGWTLAITIFGPMVFSYVLGYFTAKQY